MNLSIDVPRNYTFTFTTTFIGYLNLVFSKTNKEINKNDWTACHPCTMGRNGVVFSRSQVSSEFESHVLPYSLEGEMYSIVFGFKKPNSELNK